MKLKASVTVFFSLSLSTFIMLVVTLAGLLVMNGEKVRFLGSFDMAMNSCLGEYSVALYDKYDLLYVDTSYMQGSPDVDKLAGHLRFYMEKNAVDPYIEENGPWGCISLSQVKVPEVLRATSGKGMDMRHQAVEAVKTSSHMASYRAQALGAYGYEAVFDFLDNPMGIFESVMGTIEGMEKPTIIDEETLEEIEVNVGNPAEVIFGMCGSDILHTARIDTEGISNAGVDLSGLCSSRNPADERVDEEWNSSPVDFGAYILGKMGNYKNPLPGHRFSLEMEYVVNGGESDFSNLRAVVDRFFLQRFADNLSLALSDGKLKADARAVALALEICTMAPEFTEPVTLSILCAAAYQEAISDVHAIFSGGRVMPHKVTHRMSVARVLSGSLYYDESSEGWSYEQYLLSMMYVMEDEIWNMRVMDVMELEVRKDTGNPGFSMEGCVERIMAVVTGKGRMGNELSLQRTYGIY